MTEATPEDKKIRTLYYGDNLEILRNKIADNSVDLCYIDPPFNSKRSYFQIYNNIGGQQDKAQMQAFVDTWTWDKNAENGFLQITTNQGGRFTRQAIELIRGLEIILGKSDLLAYLVSMTLRITEIFKVLKPTGSFYLHCDPTASHYIKLVLDAIFCSQGGDFRNEIIWKRSVPHNDARKFGSQHDTIFYYVKSNKYFWKKNYQPHSEEYIKKFYKYKDSEGRSYQLTSTTAPGGRGPRYEFMGVIRNWRYTEKNMKDLFDKGLIIQTKPGTVPRYKRYLDEQKGITAQDIWTDIKPIQAQSAELLGYPTQKPEALLERIIKASSADGDLVLDAYCGCGTTVAVAERLNRNWIGIDITYHSISLMLKRLADSYGEDIIEKITVDGIPRDVEAARALANREDDYVRKEFEKWAVLTYTNNRAAINEKKGADKGIDGTVYFAVAPGKTERMVIQVKSGGVNRATIATLRGDMERENAMMAVLLTLEKPSKPMLEEAMKSGYYHHELMGRDYPKVQIVTAEELIEEKVRMDLPLSFESVKAGKKADKESGQLEIGF